MSELRRFWVLGASLLAAGVFALAACSETGQAGESAAASENGKARASTATGGSTGTGSAWPIYRGNPALQGVAPGTLGASFELAWTFKTGDAIVSSPTVAKGLVYFGSADEHVYAVDLQKGEKRWGFKTDDIVDAPPLVHDDRIYVGSSDFFFYALDAASGDLVWKQETEDKILGGANILCTDDGVARILVGSYDTKLYCFDALRGTKLWTYQTDNYVNATPAVFSDRVVFGGCDSILHVVAAGTGKVVARVDLAADCHVAGAVAVADGRAYFGHYGNEFVCVDLATGEPAWVYANSRHAFFSSPAITADRVVFGGRDKRMHCVDRSNGAALWTFPTRRKIDGSPVVCGDKVVFGSGDGRLYVVRLADGKEVWNYEIGQSVFSSPAVVAGMILVGSNDGRLYAFRETKVDKGR